MRQPTLRPHNPSFSSGPTAKRPGWSLAALDGALVGRSHRAAGPKARIVEVVERSRRVLGIPADHRIGILPGSDTGAFECAMWTMLGASHPMEAHRADSRAIYLRGKSGDAREGVTAFLEKRDPEFPDRVSGGLPDFFPDYTEPGYY